MNQKQNVEKNDSLQLGSEIIAQVLNLGSYNNLLIDTE